MPDPAPSATMECRICKEQILQGARKCTHCDSPQDWRRILGVSSSVLALLVALISVLTAAVPVLAKYLAGNRSAVELDFQSAFGDTVYLAAANSGNRAGRVSYGQLELPNGEVHFPLDVNPEKAFVGPGELKPLVFKFDDSYSGQLTQEVAAMLGPPPGRPPPRQALVIYPAVSATIRFQVIQFGGACSMISFPAELKCGDLACSISRPAPGGPPTRATTSRCDPAQ